MYFELHKHSQYSIFDGFDLISNIVSHAKELGMKAIGLSDHGNACGIFSLYTECKKAEIKPIMGCEAYFQPTFDPNKERFHLCLFAMNATGYKNLCLLITEANTLNFHRYGIVTFDILEKYSEGIICTSACVGGFVPRMIYKGKKDIAIKAIKRFKDIFADNFYFEIMPIKVDQNGMQEMVNEELMRLGDLYDVKCILTTDSHFTSKDDFDSYLMMHRMSKLGSAKGEGFSIEHIETTYKERYMHSEEEISAKFIKMHRKSPEPLLDNMQDLYDKIDIQLDFEECIPNFPDVEDSYEEVKRICIENLKRTNRFNKKYIDRVKFELGIIKKHDLCDYFLIVRDYVKFAHDNNIYVGPGRGSVCGSLVAEVLEITKVDAVELGTDFERFLRADKKKMPDIDLDFDSEGQKMVVEYILKKYEGKSSMLLTFGFYKRANLVNDLCKIYDVKHKAEIDDMKRLAEKYVGDVEHFNMDKADFVTMLDNSSVQHYNKLYPGIFNHFAKLYGQVKYYGTHPGGVIITKGPINETIPMARVRGNITSSYDRYSVDEAAILKFDVLAVKALSVNKEIEELSGDVFDRNHIDKKTEAMMYEYFKSSKTNGVFQLGSEVAKEVLRCIQPDGIQDIIAGISLNRPGTLKLKMHEKYSENKISDNKSVPWYEYVKDTHGTIIYQEHIMRICKGVAGIEYNDIDKLIKGRYTDEYITDLHKRFIAGARIVSGLDKDTSNKLFEALKLYMFNKGHGAGYALVSEWQMYHKVKNPLEFWLATIKYEIDEKKKSDFMAEASFDGVIFFLPHVNYTANYEIRKVEGDKIIQMGYSIVKSLGEKAAEAIESERKSGGPFTSYDNFKDRCKGRSVNSRVVETLLQDGALEFKKPVYMNRVLKYNSTLYAKGNR
jgi:DNA polymerase-3 subunit alpha